MKKKNWITNIKELTTQQKFTETKSWTIERNRKKQFTHEKPSTNISLFEIEKPKLKQTKKCNLNLSLIIPYILFICTCVRLSTFYIYENRKWLKNKNINNQSNFKFWSVCFKFYIIFNAKLLLNKYISILLYLQI